MGSEGQGLECLSGVVVMMRPAEAGELVVDEVGMRSGDRQDGSM